MKKKIKFYTDCKELPFYNYKRIMQTGDFLYMVKGYEEGDDFEVDPKEMELKFNDLIQDFMICANTSSEEIHNHSNYTIASLEYNKLSIAIEFISNIIEINRLLKVYGLDIIEENDDDRQMIDELLKDIFIERNQDLEKQKKILIQKRALHENNIAKYKEILEAYNKSDGSKEEENDIDKMFINVCLGLEIPPPDKKNISLYEFSIMTDRVIEKVKAYDKINNK